ncbi:MAG TPA: enoyl-CoA hydratase-related protein [Actinomycetota bacterium]|nr:enoyl-CoA hydratase-related protein [Actinomycetota bacterium]
MTVEFELSGHRANLTLNRPEVLNAMDWDTFEALARTCDELAEQRGVRVVVVSGEGRSLSSGIDTSAFSSPRGSMEDMIVHAQAGFRKLAALPVPTIAAVKGHALGAGLQLALACDIRVAASDASLGLLEHRFGILPDLGGTQQLPRLVGPGMAKKMIWSQERIDGAEARRRGLVEVVVEPDELDSAVDDLVALIVAAPPTAVREVKRLVDLSGRVPIAEGMDEEARGQVACFGSSDFGEAIAAFVEKRAPDFG